MSNTLFKSIFSLTLLVCCNEMMAENQLKITPESCVLIKNICETKIKVQWQLESDMPVCVKIHNQQIAVTCFEKQSPNSYTTFIKTKKSLVVELIDADSQNILIRQVLDVFTGEVKKRKRKRHAWSVIL